MPFTLKITKRVKGKADVFRSHQSLQLRIYVDSANVFYEQAYEQDCAGSWTIICNKKKKRPLVQISSESCVFTLKVNLIQICLVTFTQTLFCRLLL